ncbi:MAG: transporter substrate-binding domain-containing protein [Desulfuromonadales bacterium]|nr:transporter substrate-binding domain-containing protein [Desulfuromonadales bacterium]
MFKKSAVYFFVFLMFSSAPVFADTLILVTLQSPPAEYTENGQPAGRNIEITQAALRRMGYACEIKLVPWERALKMVKNGEADGIIDVAYNKERAEYLHYPEEVLYVEEWYGFKLTTSDLTLDKELENAGQIQLGTSRGFEYGGIIQDAINNKRFKSIQEVRNNELNIIKLVGQRFDMFIGVKSTISFLAKKMGYQDQIERVKMTGTDQDYLLCASKTYLGFSKKTMKKEIAEEFSKVLADMKKEGTIKQIEDKMLLSE